MVQEKDEQDQGWGFREDERGGEIWVLESWEKQKVLRF
jgi:hypothetical protein